MNRLRMVPLERIHATGSVGSKLVWTMTAWGATAAVTAVVFTTCQQVATIAETWVAILVAISLATLSLIAVSGLLHRSVHWVRRERQREFRTTLIAAGGVAATLIGVQAFLLVQLIPGVRAAALEQVPLSSHSGLEAFVIAVVTSHGLIATGASLLLSRICVEALTDRYDHEYYVGPQAAAMLWHGLTVGWLFVLTVLAIAA